MSGGYSQSPASPCWVAGNRRGCRGFPVTDRRPHASPTRAAGCRTIRWALGAGGSRRTRHRGGGCEPHRARHDRPAARCPSDACLALLGHRAACGADRRHRTQQHAPTPERRCRQALAQNTVPPAPAAPVLPMPGTPCYSLAGALAPARASARHPHTADGAWGHHDGPHTQDGAHAAPASVHGTIGRHGSQHDDGLGPRLPWGLRRAGVAAMLQGTRCVWPAAVVPGLLFPGPRQKARLRNSNPTLPVSGGPQVQMHAWKKAATVGRPLHWVVR
jgi:hypothetical protein